MIYRLPSPRRRRRLFFYAYSFIGSIVLFDFVGILYGYKAFESNLSRQTVVSTKHLPSELQHQKIYIVAQFWSNADVLVRYWQDAVLSLIDAFGTDNVYLSIVSSKGLDNTDQILRHMETHLLEPRNVPRTIIYDSKTHQDEMNVGPLDENGHQRPGWLRSGASGPHGQQELRRIPYLARLRNQGLEPLLKMKQDRGTTYDKILFLNDVIFRLPEVLSLLATNGGHYDAACALDFQEDTRYYDTFALRDANFDPTITRSFPFFRSSVSRNAILRGLPTPVKSCWNGIMVADAAPYYRQGYQHATKPGGLRFRGIPDSLAAYHLEASECCLIHADLIASGQATRGIYVNPAVRVAYARRGSRLSAYNSMHTGPKGLGWLSVAQYVRGVWINRVIRWVTVAQSDAYTVARRVARWKNEGQLRGENSDSSEHREETGQFCIISEMHVLIANGWKHVDDDASRWS